MTFTLERIIDYALFILIVNLLLVFLGDVWKNNSYWLANSELPHSTKHYDLFIH